MKSEPDEGPMIFRWTIRIGCAAIVAVFAGYIPYHALGPKGWDRVVHLRDEIYKISDQNDQLEQENNRLRQEIKAISSGSKGVERLLQKELGFVKDTDLVYRVR